MNRMRASSGVAVLAVISLAALVLLSGADASRVDQDRIDRYRNLGKAFYENPTAQPQAVEEFKKALDLAPNSAREHVNYGLALLRAGKTKEGVAELERAQKLDPKIPHTWFNLGIAFKKEGECAPGRPTSKVRHKRPDMCDDRRTGVRDHVEPQPYSAF